MSVSSRDFLQFASECLSGEDEIWFRNAVARSYYAAYHHTRKHFPQAPQESHARLICYLAGEEAARKEPATENQLKSLAYILREMKKKRIIADYKLEKTVSRREAENCIQQCNKLIKKISDINTQ